MRHADRETGRRPCTTRLGTLGAIVLLLGWAGTLQAMERPTPAQLAQYKADGTLAARAAQAREFGNDKVNPELTLDFQYRMKRLALEQKGLSPAEIDQILPTFPPGTGTRLKNKGVVKVFALLLDFSDYPSDATHYPTPGTINAALFGDGVPTDYPRESLRNYYRRSSYSQLDIGGVTLGYYRPAYSRASMAQTTAAREALIMEALTSFDATTDFSQFDNDGDGKIDYFCVLWTGPSGPWASFWWGYYTGFGSSFTLDGKQFQDSRYSWQWTNTSTGLTFPPLVVIHETGHSLGLPDLYDYDGAVGPDGGVGGLDMMDANWGDHNCFSKMLLDWITPAIAVNGSSYTLSPSSTSQQAMIMWPGYSLASPFTEFYMIQNRTRTGNDTGYPADGLVIWHIDATLAASNTFLYDNSYASHKLVRLMEADGLEQIEAGGSVNAGDFYVTGRTFGNATVPNSNEYAGNPTLVGASGITPTGSDFTFTAGDTVPAFTTSVSSVTVPEGGTATFQVKLSLAPAGTVNATVSRASGDTSVYVSGGASLSFTTGNWSSYQTVTLTAAEDADLLNGTATIRVSAPGVADRDITATELDNEVGLAVYDPTLHVPACAAQKAGCDSTTLLTGRDTMSGGNEPNQPNTLASAPACADGTAGLYFGDESIERIRLTSQDGLPLAPGKTVLVEVTAYVYNPNVDFLDLYYSGTTSPPSWTLIATITPGGTGLQTMSTTYVLPTGNLQAVRANFRYLGSVSSCSTGSYNDHDDLVFTAAAEVPVTFVTSSAGLFVSEGGTGTFQVKLSAQPAATVTASVAWASGDTDLSVTGGSTLTFDSSNWNIFQTVTINAAEDADRVNSSATIRVSAAGLANKDVVAIEIDNDPTLTLLWRHAGTGVNYAWPIAGSTLLTQIPLLAVSDLNWEMAGRADFNGDGQADLVWRNFATGQNVVWYMNGQTFLWQAPFATVPDRAWQIVAASDINLDGQPDLVWHNAATGENAVWFLNGTSLVSTASLPTVTDTMWQMVGVADFNGDGHPDLVWRHMVSGQNGIWYLDGVTKIGDAGIIAVPDLRWYVGAVGDCDLDGHPDLVWRNAATGENAIWYLNGSSLLSTAALPPAPDVSWDFAGHRARPVPVKAASDFNRDGQVDLLWRNTSTGENAVWSMNGSTLAAASSLPSATDANWQLAASADLNRDGQADLIWRHRTTGQNAVWNMAGTTLAWSGLLPILSNTNLQLAAVADITGDGKPDVVWRNVSTGQNLVWIMNGATMVSSASLTTVSDTNWRIVAAADFNGDGKSDLLWRHLTSGQNAVWYMDGLTKVGDALLPTVADPNWQIGMAADFNADGKPDIVWRNYSTGQNVIWLMNGATYLGNSWLPAVADVNWVLLKR